MLPPSGPTADGLACVVVVERPALRVEVDLTVAPGEIVALVGPNGAGKSTVLHALAGLEPLVSGRITLDGEVLDDAADVFRPPERRSIGIVFQDHRLLPALSVLDNVGFGLRARSASRGDARSAAAEWLEHFGVGDLASRRPAALSGGQAQRVALARALAARPRMLLLDEPFAALDAQTRTSTRRLVAEAIRADGCPTVLVTHDPVEAAALADRIVVVENGRVVQQGCPADLRTRPRSRYVADLVGVNLVHGDADGTVLRSGDGVLTLAEPRAGAVVAVVHPRAVAVHRVRPEGGARNVWSGRIARLEPAGDRVRVEIVAPIPLVAEVTAAASRELGLELGHEVWVAVKATEIDVFPV